MTSSDISRHRSALMGMAMIIVILFHIPLAKEELFRPLARCGNLGVDIFLFLSGVGLWYGFQKNNSIVHFYRRRLLRLYPAWLVVASLFYISGYVTNGPSHYTPDVLHLVFNILIGLSFWLYDDGTFWYVPAIMAMYVLAPWFMKSLARWKETRYVIVLLVLWCFVVQYFSGIHHAVGHIEIFWSRLPIFFIGICCGEWVKAGQTVSRPTMVMAALIFVMSLAVCMNFEDHLRGRFPLFIERMVYIPLSITTIILFTSLFNRLPQRVVSMIAFVGTVSLEVYLLHIEYVFHYIKPYHLGYWLNFLLILAITLPVAWLLNKAIAFVCKKIGL